MRKFALFASAGILALSASFVRAQQVDFAIGAGTLLSSGPKSSAQGFLAPAEHSGIYPSASLEFIRKNHFGINAEIAFRVKQGLYNGFQGYRPVLYDVNAVYSRTLAEDIGGEVMAGVGGESVIFYNRFSACKSIYPVCPISLSSTHLLGHVGGGVRYYFWRSFFLRPEAHLYVINNNQEFHSKFVGRGTVSLGYTFGRK